MAIDLDLLSMWEVGGLSTVSAKNVTDSYGSANVSLACRMSAQGASFSFSLGLLALAFCVTSTTHEHLLLHGRWQRK